MKNLASDELLCILRVHEVHICNRDHLTKRDSNALKSRETSSKRGEWIRHCSRDSRNDEVAFIFKKFKHVMKKKGKFQHSSKRKDTRFKKKYKEKYNEIICIECQKLGHMKAKCPQLKKKRYSGDKKRKV